LVKFLGAPATKVCIRDNPVYPFKLLLLKIVVVAEEEVVEEEEATVNQQAPNSIPTTLASTFPRRPGSS
jgi:hypothetical protein